MKSGKELDELVAKALGWRSEMYGSPQTLENGYRAWYWGDFNPSTDIKAAWIAWEWLEKNHPWGPRVFLSLCRSREHPTVRLSQRGEWEEIVAYREVIGESYPHAICLAVVLATKETEF